MPQDKYNHLLTQRGGRYNWEAMPNPDLQISDLDENAIIGAVRAGINCGRLPETTIREEIPAILELSIPYKALRECCINAFCHRAYHRPGSSVGIAIYDDRVEIESSGTFPPDMTLEKLLGGHSSEPPNLIIANVLYKSELLESWGRGIKLMIDECRRVSIPDPEFHTNGSAVWVTFRYKNEAMRQVPDKYHPSTTQAPPKHHPSTTQAPPK